MNDATTAAALDESDEEMLTTTVSDEALEAAAGATALRWSDPFHCTHH